MEDVAQLINGLGSPEPATRRQAAQQFAQGGAAGLACVALANACDDADEATREWVVAALEEAGPPPADQQPSLIKLLSHDCALTRYWAATLLGRLGAAVNADSVERLAQVIEHDPDMAVRERAAWALAEMGQAAEPARSALAAAAAGNEGRLARLAKKALDSLGG
jgi:HEAT repeat protein